MLNIIVIILTFIFTVLGLVVATWSYIDTKRILSQQEFISDREKKRQEAKERFKSRTRLGKKHD